MIIMDDDKIELIQKNIVHKVINYIYLYMN